MFFIWSLFFDEVIMSTQEKIFYYDFVDLVIHTILHDFNDSSIPPMRSKWRPNDAIKSLLVKMFHFNLFVFLGFLFQTIIQQNVQLWCINSWQNIVQLPYGAKYKRIYIFLVSIFCNLFKEEINMSNKGEKYQIAWD